MRPRLLDAEGRWRRPFVYALAEERGDPTGYRVDTSRRFPLRLFPRDAVTRRLRLLGVDEPCRLFLLGSDGLGRDQLSRLLHGGRISLLAGLLATLLSLGLALAVGSLAGYYGGALDAVLMRAADLFLALPWLYLLFAVRAFLPLSIEPSAAFLMIVLVIGLLDWARPARLVRGVVLAAKGREYVLAARGFGASDLYLIRRHVLPQTLGVLLTQAALLAPQYVLAEVWLSFSGLGVGEPTPSWGNMLAALQQYHVMASYWWMWLPGLVLLPLFLGYYALSDTCHRRFAASWSA